MDANLILELPFKEGKASELTAIVSPCRELNPIILSAAFLATASKESNVKASAVLIPFNLPLPLTDLTMPS